MQKRLASMGRTLNTQKNERDLNISLKRNDMFDEPCWTRTLFHRMFGPRVNCRDVWSLASGLVSISCRSNALVIHISHRQIIT